MQQASEVYIYGLVDPRDGVIRYIGQTHDLAQRLQGHYVNAEKGQKQAWIAALRGAGVRPMIRLLETTQEAQAYEREQHWIDYYRGTGLLLNGDNFVAKIYKNQLAVMVSDDTLQELDSLSRKTGCSRSDIIRKAIDCWLKDAQQTKGKQK